jgi:L-seryl-tRNA(Ser) seleniumtransferase
MNPYRDLPSINELVEAPAIRRWRGQFSREYIVAAARQVLAAARRRISTSNASAAVTFERIVTELDDRLNRPPLTLGKIINGTGVILHTGLGRAPLSERALQAVWEACRGYAPLELSLESGKRGRRIQHVRSLLCALTGAESATVVNNNAAALVIALQVLATGKEVVVSRGELIEIGGGFRLPEIIAASGARLREVGTTNRTQLSDYDEALSDETGAILKIHPSNYQINGFTHSVSLEELAALARRRCVAVIHDIGSGAPFDLRSLGLADEPVAKRSLEAGADLVTFSGDKLLGGPQAGIIAGRQQYIERIERTPLMRALRVDKMTLAALSATLSDLSDPQQAAREIPVWRMLLASAAELERRGGRLVERLREAAGGVAIEWVPTTAYIGGGSLPNQKLASVAISLHVPDCSEERLARQLRVGAPAVLARLSRKRLLIDLRAILPEEDEELLCAVREAIRICRETGGEIGAQTNPSIVD